MAMNIRPEKIDQVEDVFYPIPKPVSQVKTEDLVNLPIEPAPAVRVEETVEQKRARRQLNAARLRAKNEKSRRKS